MFIEYDPDAMPPTMNSAPPDPRYYLPQAADVKARAAIADAADTLMGIFGLRRHRREDFDPTPALRPEDVS